MTQQSMILNHLKKNRSITPLEALELYSVYRLSARICELRRQGYNIVTSDTEGLNKFGDPTRYAKYVLVDRAVE